MGEFEWLMNNSGAAGHERDKAEAWRDRARNFGAYMMCQFAEQVSGACHTHTENRTSARAVGQGLFVYARAGVPRVAMVAVE
jgi:hypothetical protein